MIFISLLSSTLLAVLAELESAAAVPATGTATNPVPLQVDNDGLPLRVPVRLEVVQETPPTAAAWVTNTGTVYLDDRKDGIEGDGTLANPYDASTPDRFKAAWAKSGSQVTLLPGRYVIGDRLFASGKSIYGRGASLFYSNNVGGGFVFTSPARLEGFSLDLGTYSTNRNFTPCAVLLTGNAVVKECTITGLRGNRSINSEAFGVLVFGDFNTVERCTITNAVIWEYTYANAIAVSGGFGHRILNNTVSLDRFNSPTNWTWGIGTSADGCVVSGNVVCNVANAVHMDISGLSHADGAWEANTYTGNYLQGSMRTIRIDATSQNYRNFVFEGNTVVSRHTGAHYAGAERYWTCDTLVFLQCTVSNGISDFLLTGNQFIGGKKYGGEDPFVIKPLVGKLNWGLNTTNR